MIPKRFNVGENYSDEGFGWEDFTLLSRDNKNTYLASTLYQSLVNTVGEDIASAVVEKWAGVKVDETAQHTYDRLPYLDHQSVMALPMDWGEKGIHKGFFDAFRSFVLSDEVAILGGNDNSDGHPLHARDDVVNTDHMGLPLERGSKGFVVKEENGYWVLFDRGNGTKVRVSFDQPMGFNPTKAGSPELVDIKITDYCPFGCEYCYQDSTPKGKHAPMKIIGGLADSLGEMQTFEVALGGGEPTMHPDFVKILKRFRDNNIVPNFTTKSTHWMTDESLRTQILEYCGSFAYSVENGKEAQEVIDICNTNDIPTKAWGDKGLVLHYVMGVGTEQDFKDVLKVARDNWVEVTLLGYKTNGRGHIFEPKNNGNWVEYIKKLHNDNECPHLGIDTKLAQVSRNELESAGISDVTYHTEEGKFSMYIDAVNGLIAPSSYCDVSEMQMLEFQSAYQAKDTLLEHFRSF